MPDRKQPLRASDMDVGEVWIMFNPCRLVRVEARETLDFLVPGSQQTIPVPALRLRATLPTFAVPDVITPQQAARNSKFIEAIWKDCLQRETNDTEWEEVYAERRVPPIKVSKDGGAYYIDDDPKLQHTWPVQFYCVECIGRLGSRDARSYAARGQLDGVKVAPEYVPEKLFGYTPESAAVAEQVVAQAQGSAALEGQPVSPEVRERIRQELLAELKATKKPAPTRMTIMRAKKLARDNGIDVSDISGKGALKKVLQRIKACQEQKSVGVAE